MESALREGGGEPGLRLIETVLWDGAGAPRWPLHLARLRRSAGLLGWVCPEVVPDGPDHPARLLHPAGHDHFAMLREKLHWSETPERLRVAGAPR